MSRNAHIEEASESDSDPSDMDPSEFDPAFANSLIRPADIAPLAAAQSQELKPMSRAAAANANNLDRAKLKKWSCLYPVYFDANRSRAEGRRVGKELAVQNPLAREIADAVAFVGFNVAFEPDKTHPKDWANPGRVKLLFKEDGKNQNAQVNNSMYQRGERTLFVLTIIEHHLYILVAKYLQAHPTTEDSPLRVPVHGLPAPERGIPPPAAPRGWKMNTILPLHSPAMSGGGVSDNIFKDMMQGMQGGSPAGQIEAERSGLSGGQDMKKKKQKKLKA